MEHNELVAVATRRIRAVAAGQRLAILAGSALTALAAGLALAFPVLGIRESLLRVVATICASIAVTLVGVSTTLRSDNIVDHMAQVDDVAVLTPLLELYRLTGDRAVRSRIRAIVAAVLTAVPSTDAIAIAPLARRTLYSIVRSEFVRSRESETSREIVVSIVHSMPAFGDANGAELLSWMLRSPVLSGQRALRDAIEDSRVRLSASMANRMSRNGLLRGAELHAKGGLLRPASESDREGELHLLRPGTESEADE